MFADAPLSGARHGYRVATPPAALEDSPAEGGHAMRRTTGRGRALPRISRGRQSANVWHFEWECSPVATRRHAITPTPAVRQGWGQASLARTAREGAAQRGRPPRLSSIRSLL